jgi:hypothetical protein
MNIGGGFTATIDDDSEDESTNTFHNPDTNIWDTDIRVPNMQVIPDSPITGLSLIDPNTRVPDIRVPDIQVPNTRVPNTRVTDTRVPNTRVPDIQVSDIRVQNIRVVSDMSVSGASLIEFLIVREGDILGIYLLLHIL